MALAKSYFSLLDSLDHVVFSSNEFGNLEGGQPCVQWFMKTDSSIVLRKSEYSLKDLQWTYFQPATQIMGFGWILYGTLTFRSMNTDSPHVYYLYKMWWILCINSVVYTPREDPLCFVHRFSLSVLPRLEIIPSSLKQLKTSPSAWPQAKLILM